MYKGGNSNRTVPLRPVQFSVRDQIRPDWSSLVWSWVRDFAKFGLRFGPGLNLWTEFEQNFFYFFPGWRWNGRFVQHRQTVQHFCPTNREIHNFLPWLSGYSKGAQISGATCKAALLLRRRPVLDRSDPVLGQQPTPNLVFSPGRSGPGPMHTPSSTDISH